jgi:hypothetical protein
LSPASTRSIMTTWNNVAKASLLMISPMIDLWRER